MEEKEIIENNKLIAEFVIGKAIMQNSGVYVNREVFIISGRDYLIDRLEYHSDWNWLMGAIDKISEFGFVITFGFMDDEYFETKVYYSQYDKELESSYETYCKDRSKKKTPIIITWDENKILSVYKAVIKIVEFIKWRNSQTAVTPNEVQK